MKKQSKQTLDFNTKIYNQCKTRQYNIQHALLDIDLKAYKDIDIAEVTKLLTLELQGLNLYLDVTAPIYDQYIEDAEEKRIKEILKTIE